MLECLPYPALPCPALQFSKIATVEDTPPGNMVDVIGQSAAAAAALPVGVAMSAYGVSKVCLSLL